MVEDKEGIYENTKKELAAFKLTPIKVDLRCKRCFNCSHRVVKNCELGTVLGIELIKEVWCSKWEYEGRVAW